MLRRTLRQRVNRTPDAKRRVFHKAQNSAAIKFINTPVRRPSSPKGSKVEKPSLSEKARNRYNNKNNEPFHSAKVDDQHSCYSTRQRPAPSNRKKVDTRDGTVTLRKVDTRDETATPGERKKKKLGMQAIEMTTKRGWCERIHGRRGSHSRKSLKTLYYLPQSLLTLKIVRNDK